MSERMIDRDIIKNMPDVIAAHEISSGQSCSCRLCNPVPEKDCLTLECECDACGCSFIWEGQLEDKIICINCGETV